MSWQILNFILVVTKPCLDMSLNINASIIIIENSIFSRKEMLHHRMNLITKFFSVLLSSDFSVQCYNRVNFMFLLLLGICENHNITIHTMTHALACLTVRRRQSRAYTCLCPPHVQLFCCMESVKDNSSNPKDFLKLQID